jgi:hypothetical protein
MVDLLHNFYITWGKKQDKLELKFEKPSKEHQQATEKYLVIQNNISLILRTLEEVKAVQTKISKNSDYIKVESSLI